METIRSMDDLEAAIQLLETKKVEEEKIMKEIFYQAYESMKPINIVKNIFKEAKEGLEPHNIKDSLLGIGIGFLSKIIFQSIVRGPFKKILGTAVMIGVEKLVTKYPEIVKSLPISLLEILNNQPHKKSSDKALETNA